MNQPTRSAATTSSTRPRQFQVDAIVADTREQSKFLETLRAIQTIKVGGGEVAREAAWHNLYADKLNSAIKVSNVQITFQTIASLLTRVTDIIVIYLAASKAINGLMTVGMITAFMAYKDQFMTKMISLLDQAIQFWLLDVQLSRVSDIALADRERNLKGSVLERGVISGPVRVGIGVAIGAGGYGGVCGRQPEPR